MNDRDEYAEGLWAVVFTSRLKADPAGYAETARRMADLARQQPGFAGMHSARGADGVGITVSWWNSREAIARWRNHPEHREVRERAGEWYESWEVRVLKMEEGNDVPRG